MFACLHKHSMKLIRTHVLFQTEVGGSLPASFIYTQTFKRESNVHTNIIDMKNVMVRITDFRLVSNSRSHDNIYVCTRETSTTIQKISVAQRKTLESFQ